MKIRRLAILSFLGLMMLLSGAYATRAQNVVVFEPGRYRVNYRNYRTDQRGATLLREAVRRGYVAGYEAGRADREGRRHLNWRRNHIYMSGNEGYESYVGQSYYRYYFQQGFQRGYQDGFYSRTRYGTGTEILANVLNGIFRAVRH
ncbi:MAG: hypothetical protein DMF62_10165 [Acidobacteria bacterium]|nr:MAG: hypothetical protein DMF62_10165 [Acidobacteriota bacterium]